MRNKAKYRLRTLYIIHCALLCIMLCGCRPRGVLSSSEMRSVLHDLHHAEAVLQVAGYNYGHDEAVAKYYQQILDNHGVTQTQFDSSLVWYTNHPQRFDKIYPRVVRDLEADREEWRVQHELKQTLLNRQAEEMEQQKKTFEDLEWELQHGLPVRYLMGEPQDNPADTLPPLLPPLWEVCRICNSPAS